MGELLSKAPMRGYSHFIIEIISKTIDVCAGKKTDRAEYKSPPQVIFVFITLSKSTLMLYVSQ